MTRTSQAIDCLQIVEIGFHKHFFYKELLGNGYKFIPALLEH